MSKIWNKIKKTMHFCIYNIFKFNLSGANWEKLCQFVKFGLVGLSNTFISYVIYIFLISLSMHYMIASLFGFLISVINAYYWNNRYVFEKQEQAWWKTFLKTFMSYAGTGLILNNLLLFLWINILGIDQILGPILNLFITIPINFVLNKFWAFKVKN